MCFSPSGFGSLTRRQFLAQLSAGAALLQARADVAPKVAPRLSVRDFDAKGDGEVLDTPAIQRAIDAASGQGRAEVWFPSGRYLTGTLIIKSGVTIHLDQGATLLGSIDAADYKLIEPFTDGVGATRGYALIGCIDARGAGIKGAGIIDGRGAALQASGGKGPSAKPFLLLCLRSTGIVIEGVTLKNSSAWTAHISQCSDLRVKGISIRSVGLGNNDGIDIDSSQKVTIEDCTIETDDDSICLKTTSRKACKDITVRGCTLTSRCAAFKIGTESEGDFSAIRVSDCHVIKAGLGAIKILSVDGAEISDVLVERIRVDDADTPIFLRLGDRGRTFRPNETKRPGGKLSGITIRDVDVQHARHIGIVLSGIPGHLIEDVTLERITMKLGGDPFTKTVSRELDENPGAYPEVRMFGGDFPAFGLYGRHLRRLHMADVKITGIAGDVRPELVLSDTDD